MTQSTATARRPRVPKPPPEVLTLEEAAEYLRVYQERGRPMVEESE